MSDKTFELSVTDALRWMLDSPRDQPLVIRTHGEQVAAALVIRALRGDLRVVKEIIKRTEGRARLATDSSEDDPLDQLVRDVQEMSRHMRAKKCRSTKSRKPS